MAGNKYLYHNDTTGLPAELAANQTSAGATDAGKIVALRNDGTLDPTLFPTGIGQDVIMVTAGEALSAGNFVYIDSTGKAYKADATAPAKYAIGFVLAAAAANGNIAVYFRGQNTALSSLTVGSSYFLSASSPGGASTTVVTTSGYISQYLGKAISASTISFTAEEPITRA